MVYDARSREPEDSRGLLPAVALLSAAALGYEIVLLRVFSMLYWHHFAHMIISMALLGIGVSGSVLTLCQDRLARHLREVFFAGSLAYAVSVLASATLAGRIGFNPPETLWSAGQFVRLAAVFAVATPPFFFAGVCIGLTLRCGVGRVERIYRADLVGGACGALLTVALLFRFDHGNAARVLAGCGVLAAVTGGGARSFGLPNGCGLTGFKRSRAERAAGDRGAGGRRTAGPLAAAATVLLIAVWPSAWLTPLMSPFKDLPRMRLVPGVTVAGERLSPTGVFTALHSGRIPFRFAPGLSLYSPETPPRQAALFRDGHSAGTVQSMAEGLDGLRFLRWTPMALPYVLTHRPRTLVLGAGGGGDVWHALLEGAERVDAVEPHTALTALAEGVLGDFGGRLSERPEVRRHPIDPRGFLAGTRDAYDLVKISPLGTAAPPEVGGHALAAQFLFTREGLGSALSRLSPKGVLAVTLPLEIPPRNAVRFLDTTAGLLQEEWDVDPALHMAAIRAWNSVTVVACRFELRGEHTQAVRAFCRSRGFDLVWLHDLQPEEINRVNVLERPYFNEAASAILLGDRVRHRRSYPFKITPVTDDRPYFGHFFRWRGFRELWAQRVSGSAALLEWEYLLLWIGLAVAAAISLPSIVLPLLPLFRRARRAGCPASRLWAQCAYFAALGLAFLFVEIAFLQKFVLFLSHPVHAMAVVVPSFLLFAGLGSGCASRLVRKPGDRGFRKRPVALAAFVLLVVMAVYAWLLPALFRAGAAWPAAGRAGLSVLLIGCLAFWMGMPFPLGLRRLAVGGAFCVPMAWGVNGFFSVISAMSATIVGMHAGFRAVLMAAALLYLSAAVLEERL